LRVADTWPVKPKPSIQQIHDFLESIGTVELTEVGTKPGTKVVGKMSLGDEKYLDLASGEFSIPVVEIPRDYVQEKSP
jgi:hypothetical protein